MTRTTLARRYAPLALALAVQLIIIVTAPSTAQKGTTLASGNGGGFTTGGVGGEASAAGAAGSEAVGAGGAAGVGGGTAGGAAARGGVSVPPGVSNAGDTSHCVGGREYDAAL